MSEALSAGQARLRGLAFAAGPLVVLFLITQFLLPGSPGEGRGTPIAILFQGLVAGLLLALSAVGIVVLYRTLRIVNFAQASMGIISAVFLTLCMQFTKVPFLVAFVISIGLAAFLGLVVGVFTLRFFNSSRLYLSVVTIIGSEIFFQLITWVIRWPFFPDINERPVGVVTPEDFRRLLPFAGFDFQVGSLGVNFGFAEVFAIEIAVLTLAAIGIFFRYTKSGVAVRGLAENSERASLLGIGIAKLSIIVWTVSGALAGVTVALGSVTAGASGGGSREDAFNILLPVLTAAVIGRMTNLPVTIYVAVLLGIGQKAWNYSFREDITLFNVVLFALLMGALLLQRKRLTRSEESGGTAWSGTDEPRPVPKELSRVAVIRVTRIAFVAIAAIGLIVFPFVAPTGRTLLLGVVFVTAIAVLSLVVLTGWAGQVSLGQWAFVGVGAVVGGSLTSRAGVPFWFALPLGTAVTGAVAFVVGLPALRVRGLFLLVTTFGFAVVVQSMLFDRDLFGWLLPTEIDRPTLLFIDFDDERSMYFLCLAALALALVVVGNLRRSRVGRLLIAMRENEPNVQAFGISATRAKLLAFVVSGAMCGFAGVIFAHQQRGVAQESFLAFRSVEIFVQGVFGGVSSGGGAILGATYYTFIREFFGSNQILGAFLFAGGPLLIVFLAPGGLISLVNQARDSMLKIVAQRRQIVVPSLFADYDADALERRLIPLGEASHSSGLAALPTDERFSMASELYAGRGERIIEKLGPKKTAVEESAIAAAGRSVAELEAAEPQTVEASV